MRFPEGFVWGAASSAIQIEGSPRADGGGESVWDRFAAQPGKIAGGETPEIACDAYARFEEDVELLARMGLGAYRFSTSWARVDPLGDGNWNEAGVDFYLRVVDACLKRGVEPYVTLHHWELPQALQDAGGWQNPETARAFARFAGMMAARLRGRVRRYFTLNEPQCILALGHQSGVHAPGLRLSQDEIFACWKQLMRAHGLAMRAIKEADEDAEVGIATTGRLCYPATAADVAAAARASFRQTDEDWLFSHNLALDAVCFGRLEPDAGTHLAELASAVSPEEWAEMRCPPDFIGANIYNGSCVQDDGAGGERYLPRDVGFPRTALKWPVTERVMNDGVCQLYARYRLPIYISENGLSCNDKIYLDGQVHDLDRIDFLARYLFNLREAARHVDLRGYFHWSLTDNFEWHSGYAERFGLIYIDYPTQKRILKDSARWYARIAATNGELL